MIRPEVRELAWRWREVLIGLALVLAGIWALAQAAALIKALGALLVLAGLALAVIGARRARFVGPEGAGPGIVDINERQIVYMAPEGGGFIALDDITRLSLSADGQRWLIGAADGSELAVPLSARGAGVLFDAFAALPGMDIALVVRAMREGAAAHARPLWQRRGSSALLTRADARDR